MQINISPYSIMVTKVYLFFLAPELLSLFSHFTTITDIPVGISSASISLVFLVTNGFVKLFLKTMGNTKNQWVFESLRKQNVFESNVIIWSYIVLREQK